MHINITYIVYEVYYFVYLFHNFYVYAQNVMFDL
jgi:hypothetical protein